MTLRPWHRWATYSLLEQLPLLQRERVGFGNDWHDIDDLGQLLEHDDVDLSGQLMSSRRRTGVARRTGLSVCPVGLMKKRQQCTRVSGMCLSRKAVSSLRRYAECWSLICKGQLRSMPRSPAELTHLTIGSQQLSLLIKSPYPGVSMMLSFRRTLFSVMTVRVSCSSTLIESDLSS